MRWIVALLWIPLAFAGCSGPELPPAPSADPSFQLELVLSGLEKPVWVGAPEGDERLFIAEQRGIIHVLAPDGELTPYLDLRALTKSGGERGLLGVAFSPNFADTGAIYVHHSDTEGDTQVARYHEGGDGTIHPASRHLVLYVEQPYGNHNGGHIEFGPDGTLYVALGDGGLAGDPQNHGQNKDTLLGAILRLRVDDNGRTAYHVPSDNPFGNEVYVWGLRNPWRFSFDPTTSDLWIADVGQGDVEEVTRLTKGQAAGANLGWNWYEGSFRYREKGTPPETVPPTAEYTHNDIHCSITGGHVYRGEAIPGLRGHYTFGDYCSGHLWTLAPTPDGYEMRKMLETGLRISSFGADGHHELYVVDHGGTLWRVAPL